MASIGLWSNGATEQRPGHDRQFEIEAVDRDSEIWVLHLAAPTPHGTGMVNWPGIGAPPADGLKRVIPELDPEGKNPSLRKMAVIGHSQGGF